MHQRMYDPRQFPRSGPAPSTTSGYPDLDPAISAPGAGAGGSNAPPQWVGPSPGPLHEPGGWQGGFSGGLDRAVGMQNYGVHSI